MGGWLCCFAKVIDCTIDSGCCPEYHLAHPRGEEVPGGSFNGRRVYSYCGPYTRTETRIQEGYVGVNKLDAACRAHDLAYVSGNRSLDVDKALIDRALEIARTDPELAPDARKVARAIRWRNWFQLDFK